MYIVGVVSGGLDSSTMVFDLMSQGHEVDIISFNYGQRHERELLSAAAIAEHTESRHDIISLESWGEKLQSALTQKHIEVPEGHYAEDNMKATIVPNRNMTMMSCATGIAVSRGADAIATAVHAGDHAVYPDCRPEFIHSFTATARLATDNMHFNVVAPYLESSKNDIAVRAAELGVPVELTWSCYKGGYMHCGKCGTCVERLEALAHAEATVENFQDNTLYEDDKFWEKTLEAYS